MRVTVQCIYNSLSTASAIFHFPKSQHVCHVYIAVNCNGGTVCYCLIFNRVLVYAVAMSHHDAQLPGINSKVYCISSNLNGFVNSIPENSLLAADLCRNTDPSDRKWQIGFIWVLPSSLGLT